MSVSLLLLEPAWGQAESSSPPPPPLQEVILEPGTTSVLEGGVRTRVTCIEETDGPGNQQADALYWLCECTRPGFPRLVRKLITTEGTIVDEQILEEFVEQGDEESLRRKCDQTRKNTLACDETHGLQQAARRPRAGE